MLSYLGRRQPRRHRSSGSPPWPHAHRRSPDRCVRWSKMLRTCWHLRSKDNWQPHRSRAAVPAFPRAHRRTPPADRRPSALAKETAAVPTRCRDYPPGPPTLYPTTWLCTPYCGKKICEQSIGRGFEAGVLLGNDELGKNIGFKADHRRCAVHLRQRIVRLQMLRSNMRHHTAVRLSVSTTHQLPHLTNVARVTQMMTTYVADAVALNVAEFELRIHKNVGQCHNLHSGVHSVDVVRRIGFGHAKFLRLLQGIIEGQTAFHAFENDVGR